MVTSYDKFNADMGVDVYQRHHSDVVINVSGVKFHTDRARLRNVSGYFRGMFRSILKERSSKEVVVSGPLGSELSPETMDLVLLFVNKKKIPLTADNIQDVLLASSYLDIGGLKLVCEKFLSDSLTSTNWVHNYRAANDMQLNLLHKHCMQYFVNNANKIRIRNLSYNELRILLETKSRAVESYKVFRAILHWVKCSSRNRRRYLEELLRFVDFGGIEVKYAHCHILNEKLIAESSDLDRKIREVLLRRKMFAVGTIRRGSCNIVVTYCPFNNHVVKYRIFEDNPRSVNRVAFAMSRHRLFGAGGFGSNSTALQIYNSETEEWEFLPSCLQHSRRYATACVVDDEKLFVIGGYSESADAPGTRASVEVFNIANDSCRKCEENGTVALSHGRMWHATVTKDRDIYVIGGSHRFEYTLKTCEVINADTYEVRTIASMSYGRRELAAVVFRNNIVAIGGLMGRHRLSSVEKYNADTDSWTFMPSMVVARHGHSGCIFDCKIFVVGGHGLSSVEYYDSETSLWTLLKTPRIPHMFTISVPAEEQHIS